MTETDREQMERVERIIDEGIDDLKATLSEGFNGLRADMDKLDDRLDDLEEDFGRMTGYMGEAARALAEAERVGERSKR